MTTQDRYAGSAFGPEAQREIARMVDEMNEREDFADREYERWTAEQYRASRRRPAVGDRFEVTELNGYRLVQDRPFACRPVCTCGACDGTRTRYPGTVTGIIAWMDNSTDAVVMCDDGVERRAMVDGPHGDLCF